MATQTTFGAILREARERHGLDLSTAARRLRIRPDILRAIEESDFARMPPRGYARNMVNAYARLVELNPTEITRKYLDEVYAYQVGRARSEAQPTGFDMGDSSRRTSRVRSGHNRDDEWQPQQNDRGRPLYEDRTDPSGQTYSQGRIHPSRHSAVPGAQYTNYYAGPKVPSAISSKLPFIIAGVVVLVVLAVILFLIFGNRGAASEEDVPDVPITGLTDTSNPDDGTGGGTVQQTTPVLAAPTFVTFTYAVASGNSAYIEVYEGDSSAPSVAQYVEGPAETSFDVSTTLRFVTSQPENVTITLDGETITTEQMTSSSSGVYTYTVDFPAFLEQWKTENQSADATGDATTTGDSTTAGGTATTS